MLGFGALGEFPLADFGTPNPPVSVSLPTVALLLDALGGALQAGKNFDAPLVNVAASIPVPTISFCKSFDAPTVALTLAALVPAALSGKNFDAPLIALSFATFAPILRVGKNIDAPPIALTLVEPLPSALPGKHFDAPPVSLTLSIPTVRASFGKSIGLPSVTFGYLVSDTDIQTGRILNLTNTFVVVTDGIGALGEGALGEFAIGDGYSVSATYTRPIRLKMSVPNPASFAGKNFGTPPVAISLSTPLIEVDARGRPIRINAIAS